MSGYGGNQHQKVSTTGDGDVELGANYHANATGTSAPTTTATANADQGSSTMCGPDSFCGGCYTWFYSWWEWLMSFREWFTDRELTSKEVMTNHGLLVLWLVGICILAGTLTESFHYIDYKNYGLITNTYHGVTTHKTYDTGRYLFTLDWSMIQFSSTYTLIEFTSSTFAEDGLEFDLDMRIYHRLPKNSVGDIYDQFSSNYNDRAEKNAITITKGVASGFSVDEFMGNRSYIEATIAAAIEPELLATVGVEAPAAFVKIVDMRFPDLLITTSLDTAIAKQRNKVQVEQQAVDLVVAETSRLKALVDVETVQTTEFATNEAKEITSTSEAEAAQLLLVTRSDGIQDVCSAISMTVPAEKNQLTRIFAVMDNPHSTTTMLNGVGTVLVQA